MDNTIEIDLGQAARELGLPLESVQNTVELLDDGNTVPFITRYRKDQTGALDEEQVRRVQEKVGKLRALAERKLTILKSIQSQGILTPRAGRTDPHGHIRPSGWKICICRTSPRSRRWPRRRGSAAWSRWPVKSSRQIRPPPISSARAASFVAPEHELHSVGRCAGRRPTHHRRVVQRAGRRARTTAQGPAAHGQAGVQSHRAGRAARRCAERPCRRTCSRPDGTPRCRRSAAATDTLRHHGGPHAESTHRPMTETPDDEPIRHRG